MCLPAHLLTHPIYLIFTHRTYTSTSYLIKVDLSTFALQATLAIPGMTFIRAMAIDTTTTPPYLYVGSAQSPAVIARVDLSNFTVAGTPVTAGLGEVGCQVMHIHIYIYVHVHV